MNRENEEQRPVAQTLCGALQKEPNCKCLLLSVLIYTCLAAVTWCRCANVTKIMVNFTKFPIRSTKHVSSPCDEGYIYIPVAFMGMLYLVYLVECYHSPIRIDLLHAESQDSVLSKLAQLKMAQPTIWWRAVSYHYVRRKRQITRYRNGDNYTTTQVYYERVNTHVATSAYYYDYCGVKDISKELILGAKIPITKIVLTKGFAFSNMRSATEFEETRSRFFAEQELRDDYLEMREGLDIGNNVNPTMLVAVLGNPWFTNRYVYWCLSALLLSWPLRVIIEYKTQYADYQVTKLFGVNYDTPTSGEPIHASMSQLSQPGSYMLAPSYSEALLMDPAPSNDALERGQDNWQTQGETNAGVTDMVPSYSEALLYERAEQSDRRNVIVNSGVGDAATNVCNVNVDPSGQLQPMPCECHCPCPCHGNTNDDDDVRMDERSYIEIMTGGEQSNRPSTDNVEDNDSFDRQIATLRTTADGRLRPTENLAPRSMDDIQTTSGASPGTSPSRCGNCGRISTSTQTINSDELPRAVARNRPNGSSQTSSANLVSGLTSERVTEVAAIPRDISEPNLQSRSEPEGNAFSKESDIPENALENEEILKTKIDSTDALTNLNERLLFPERPKRMPLSLPPSLTHSLSLDEASSVSSRYVNGKGAIPKTEPRSRITVNPMSSEACWKLPNSKTYFCLKSILKQNRRRYTLVTADEFQNLADQDVNAGPNHVDGSGRSEKGVHSDIRTDRWADRPRSREALVNPRRRMPSFEEFMSGRDKGYAHDQKSTRTLIFASPLQEIPITDPFRGRDIVPSRSSTERSVVREDHSVNTPVLGRLGRSPTDRDRRRVVPDYSRHRRTFSVQQEHPAMYPFHHSHAHQQRRRVYSRSLSSTDQLEDVRSFEMPRAYRNDFSLPPYNNFYNGLSPRLPESRPRRLPTMDTHERIDPRHDAARVVDTCSLNRHQFNGLTRSLTERRLKIARPDRNFRRSFTGRVEDYRTENARRANFSMETSL